MFTTRKQPGEKLADKGYPKILISVDGSEAHPARDIYLGITFFTNYTINSESRLLNLACEKGIYKALVKRIDDHCKIIKNDQAKEAEKLASEAIIFADLEKIGNLYWTVGYVHAARVLLDIGDYYHKKEKQYNRDCKREGGDFSENPFVTETAKFWNLSARYYLRSKLLMGYDKSKELIDLMYQDAGIKAAGFPSVDAGDQIMLGHVDEEIRKALKSQEEEYVETAINKNRYI